METKDHGADEFRRLAQLVAVSITAPCICQPLHRNCDPKTCEKAPLLVTERDEPEVRSSNSSSVLSIENCLLTCKMSELKQTALGGCVVCAIIYAGLKTPLRNQPSWVGGASDEQLTVKIDTDLRDVEIRHGEDFAAFTFFASPDSGKFHQ